MGTISQKNLENFQGLIKAYVATTQSLGLDVLNPDQPAVPAEPPTLEGFSNWLENNGGK